MGKERQPGLDLVRAAAIFFVIALHGITMRGALDAAMLSPVWCVKVFVRYLALSAVPLFLMLSGYLGWKTSDQSLLSRDFAAVSLLFCDCGTLHGGADLSCLCRRRADAVRVDRAL